MSGWILRAVFSYNLMDVGLYIAQVVLILGGPPIYAAAEYKILGRLMHYLPMHAPLNPSRVFFFYLGVSVETLNGVGARLAGADPGTTRHVVGGMLISVSLVLQGVVEVLFMAFLGLIYYRCYKAGILAKNVRVICIMLYCTSSLVLLRCIFRAVETFTIYTASCDSYHCGTIANNE
jgi:RTA1 like protein